jgi:hypothetical protein
MIEYLFLNISGLGNLGLFFLLNTSVIFLIVHFMYAKNSKRKDFYFSYMSIGAIVFLLCFFLNSVKLELGFALGLFAIFGIIRYRTDAIPIKEMTYLFIVIGISVLNSLAIKKVSYPELLFTNAAVVIGLWLLEKRLMLKQEVSIDLVYEKIENINKQSEKVLLEDLANRTGIEITRFEIRKIDFLRDVAEITLFYNSNGHKQEDEQSNHFWKPKIVPTKISQ